ncbi:MAG: DNA mismatch repair endonuclease MutL [Ruminococcaceae bacterium]|nr:DNA mismatch repair endonuclease MutL [Oscillospiraceae bacterium]
MGRINVLGFDVANLIAAGEVVDRPASVVKELVENSIDAGATSLTIEIKNGGKTFMRISDNGCGIDYADLPVAILRHATSKIKGAEDLEAIMTLGFRGEALAAISSVSKIRIMSKTKDSDLGGYLECHGGEVVSHMHTGTADGTTIIVEDLFYNVPARKKFLKSDKAEAGTITATVEKIALSKPDVSFRYIVDGETKFVTGGDGELANAIYAILGRDFAKKTIKVQRNEGGIKVEGYISTPELVRANRNLESFYINSRYVKSKTMGAALEQAYQSYIPSDKFPFCVLNLEINPSLVDVNVHPAKLEVKFSNENLIFSAVYYAVRGALSTSITRPELYEEPKKDTTPISLSQFPVYDREAPKNERVVFDSNSNFGILKQSSKLDYSAYDNRFNTDGSKQYGAYTVPKNDEPKQEKSILAEDVCEKPQAEEKKEEFVQKPRFIEVEEKEEKIIVPDYKIIGEAFNSYVIVELGESIYLIDKHAAHERILFEDLKKKTKLATPSSQMLMVPVEVYLTSDEMGSLSEWEDEIKSVGFSFEIKSTGVSVYEIPSEIEINATADTLVAFLSKLKDGKGDAKTSRGELFEKALYQASCKAAIKAGRIYDASHIKWICDRVLTLDNIKYCPHGRPVAFEITKHSLERQFERIK